MWPEKANVMATASLWGVKMPRQARKFSPNGFYHIVCAGAERQNLFFEDEDYQCLLLALYRLKMDMRFELHAYCLLPNRLQLLLRERQLGDISLIMKRLMTRYAIYYNKKYGKVGSILTNRYKSTPVPVDEKFIRLLRHIHQTPVRARLVSKLEEYRYCSYREYVFGGDLAETAFSIVLVGQREWGRLHSEAILAEDTAAENSLLVAGRHFLDDAEIRRKIIHCSGGHAPEEISEWPREERNALLKMLREQEQLSIRQIERVTGISRGIIAKC